MTLAEIDQLNRFKEPTDETQRPGESCPSGVMELLWAGKHSLTFSFTSSFTLSSSFSFTSSFTLSSTSSSTYSFASSAALSCVLMTMCYYMVQ